MCPVKNSFFYSLPSFAQKSFHFYNKTPQHSRYWLSRWRKHLNVYASQYIYLKWMLNAIVMNRFMRQIRVPNLLNWKQKKDIIWDPELLMERNQKVLNSLCLELSVKTFEDTSFVQMFWKRYCHQRDSLLAHTSMISMLLFSRSIQRLYSPSIQCHFTSVHFNLIIYAQKDDWKLDSERYTNTMATAPSCLMAMWVFLTKMF